jgi:predicted secreted protein
MSLLKQNIGYHIILSLISPLLALFYGVRSKSFFFIRWSIFVFTVIYGSLLTYSLFGGESGADGGRHLGRVYSHYQNLDFSIWWEELIAILTLAPRSSTNDDPYIHVISYIVGTILSAPGLFFVAVSIVYAYFFSGAIVKLVSYVNWKSGYNKFYFIFFMALLVVWKNPADMQTVRTWTGMWVLIYSVLSYHETKKKKYLLLALSPVLIHIGFFLLGFAVWVVLFTGFRNPKVYLIIFIFSIFVSNAVEQTGFLKFAEQTELGASKSKAYYLTDKKIEGRENDREQSNTNFYKRYEEYGIHRYVLSGMIFFIFFILRKRGFGTIENTLFTYGLAQASFSNFFASLYSVHSRGWHVASIFIIALMVIFLSKQNLKISGSNFLKIGLPLLIFTLLLTPYLLLKISMFINISSIFIIFLPIISWLQPEIGISIKDVIAIFI